MLFTLPPPRPPPLIHVCEGVCVCYRCVTEYELLTEVTLRLFLHSGDGTVLVCEEELLELGHFVLQHRHFVLNKKTKQNMKGLPL